MSYKTLFSAGFAGSISLLSGCSLYHNTVNLIGPDKPVSVLRAEIEAPLKLSDGPSPFCAMLVTETYMVMPEDGKVGIVDVTFIDGREATLEGDYQAMRLLGDEPEAFVGDQTQLEALFGEALIAMPAAPYYARLYFILDKDELTADSKAEAEQIYQQIVGRQNVEIIIVGHTDTAASATYNDALSLRRAEKVRQNLIDAGVAADIIKATGMGERNLLIQTPDNTTQPENRRVEINVR